MFHALRAKLRSTALGTSVGYRHFLKREYGAKTPIGRPCAPWHNAVLRTKGEVEAAVEQVARLGLPPHGETAKNWDSIAALDAILSRTKTTAQILDAGAETYSRILTWLFLYGYKNLFGINLVFDQTMRLGPIRYERGDVTATRFRENTFDAITCLSVIEHGIDLGSYFREMARILKPGGILVTSADYFDTPIDTRGQIAYGVPIHIFTRQEISEALRIASKCGLSSTGQVELTAFERVVDWKTYSLRYTFIAFTLCKT